MCRLPIPYGNVFLSNYLLIQSIFSRFTKLNITFDLTNIPEKLQWYRHQPLALVTILHALESITQYRGKKLASKTLKRKLNLWFYIYPLGNGADFSHESFFSMSDSSSAIDTDKWVFAWQRDTSYTTFAGKCCTFWHLIHKWNDHRRVVDVRCRGAGSLRFNTKMISPFFGFRWCILVVTLDRLSKKQHII